ncbi:helix-turn-helix domain-containing protein [Jatrophihabitans cynanchi]|jgi:sugar diacid utilization regulator|uniref:Helix-turn-helix domain-containing protein n=1 Tax=Jatrophihabitans cynanchi TaxID=2944128 RepID=A0ABY7K037_9ACTN|nr:helix-turn-helix domain-containing protein [Jatrophihabitans sp. SB3-54]WAX58208.1 helix-turn-helix domain-containing protein [Jatrophihabitans sp. SB3-54]
MILPDATGQRIASDASAEAGGLDPALLGEFVPDLARAVTDGSGHRGMLQRCRARGRDAARQGVALRALVEVYLAAARRLWRQLPAVAEEADAPAIAAAGELMLQAIDEAMAALAAGYQQARQSLVREQASARREFVDDLLSGRADVGALVQRAAGFGLDLAGSHAVVVVRAEREITDAAPIVPLVERAVAAGPGDAFVATKEGRLIAVFAAPDDDATRAAAARIAGVLQPTGDRVDLRRRTDIGAWRLGVGRARPGAAGVLTSYDEARDALDLSGRAGLDEPIVHAQDLLAYQVLLRDRAAIADLITSLLGPLTQARGGAQPLLDTLAAYFAAGSNTAQASRELHLSVRAVTYRLDRVRALTGANPASPRDAFALHAAVLGARLLGWPAQPL